MDTGMDFVDFLETDVSRKILTSLEDPADLARVSSVSRTWRWFGEQNSYMYCSLWSSFMSLFSNAKYANFVCFCLFSLRNLGN